MSTAAPTVADIRRFAFRQGTGRVLFDVMDTIDDSVLTTSLAPPRQARGQTGVPLPLATTELLANAGYPLPVEVSESADRLGHLLLTAFGLQRREPSNRFNDHRVVASVRAKFPVHVFVLSPGRTRYLDVHRHALVDIESGSDLTLARHEGEGVTIVLAGRYTDYPSFYTVLRGALADLEVGYNLRSLLVAAELFGVPAAVEIGGTVSREATALVRSAGPGQWSSTVRIRLGTDVAQASVRLPGRYDYADQDALLGAAGQDHQLGGIAAITTPMLELAHQPGAPALAIPHLCGAHEIDWAEVLWNRTSGRVPHQGNGFSARPATVDVAALREMAAWAGVAAPHPLLGDIQRHVRLSVAVNKVTGLAAGVYRTGAGGLELAAEDPLVMQTLDREFGYHDSPDTECGLRHSTACWVLSVDIDAILADFGPAGWSLLQLTCGWISHGLSLAAAATGHFARPARGFDEVRLRKTMRLGRGETPVFMTICGKNRFAETMLDVRS